MAKMFELAVTSDAPLHNEAKLRKMVRTIVIRLNELKDIKYAVSQVTYFKNDTEDGGVYTHSVEIVLLKSGNKILWTDVYRQINTVKPVTYRNYENGKASMLIHYVAEDLRLMRKDLGADYSHLVQPYADDVSYQVYKWLKEAILGLKCGGEQAEKATRQLNRMLNETPEELETRALTLFECEAPKKYRVSTAIAA